MIGPRDLDRFDNLVLEHEVEAMKVCTNVTQSVFYNSYQRETYMETNIFFFRNISEPRYCIHVCLNIFTKIGYVYLHNTVWVNTIKQQVLSSCKYINHVVAFGVVTQNRPRAIESKITYTLN